MPAAEPHRRRSDRLRPRPLAFGPTPGALGPADPQGVLRSLEHALDAAHRARRPLTLVAVAMPASGGEPALAGLAALIRRTMRDTDGLWRDRANGLVLILSDADGPNCEPALARLRLRMRAEGFGAVEMGRCAAPPGISAADLLDLAQQDRRAIVQGA